MVEVGYKYKFFGEDAKVSYVEYKMHADSLHHIVGSSKGTGYGGVHGP